MTEERNWAGNLRYRAAALQRPRSVEELQEMVAAASKVRALGSRHSFNDIADTSGTLISLEDIDAGGTGIVVNSDARTVTVTGGLRYGALGEELERRGFALHNFASLPHISVAGAIATATHGSGDSNGNLASAVVGLDVVEANGELRTYSRADAPDFAGMVVSLGALGIIARVTLEIQPTFLVRQDVFENLPWTRVLENFDAVTSSAYSVSLFTDWRGEAASLAWLKSRVTDSAPAAGRSDFFGGTPALQGRHPLPGVSAVNCTEQLGVPGPWSDRLAHFRMAFTPSSGDELQTEYLVPRGHAVGAIEVMRSMSKQISPLLLVSEIRTMAADDLWLSANYGRDGIGLHLTWKPEQGAVERLLPLLEEKLAAFDARPHWGKLFHAEAAALEPLYPRFTDFKAMAERVDPEHKFRNAFLDRKVFGV
ncbi:FAD-binding protein [Paenarthrobacter sp. Z7-10]|uniref:FAD-binding protein n=1 Tax=Paenarthrobacter sp. Z7-10 TaxID=2787635 RepID=UPI0022A93FDE|nr:FAD-binding protein [Paenarthrobacter sp. Z7-10]MCZ2403156.1 FAD-binding protein [Paenarthrobacter sp. Z7-10]